MFDEIKGLLKHSSVYSLGNLLSKVVSFIMLPVYTRALTPSDYGTLEILTLSASVITMLLSLRLTSALPRFYFGYTDQKKKDTLVSTMVIFAMLISAVVALILFECRPMVSQVVFKTPDKAVYFGYVFASMVFEICGQLGYTYLRVMQRSMLFVGFSMLQLVLGLSLNILFLVFMKLGVMGVLYSMVLSNGLVFLAMQVYTFSRVGFGVDLAQFKQVLKFSLPLVPASLATFVLNMGDRFILTRFVGTEDIGIYSLGYKFGILLGVFVGTPFLQAWEPKRVELFEKNPQAKLVFQKVFLYIFFLLCFGGIVLSSLIKEIVTITATPNFLRACIVTPYVVFGYAFYIISAVVDIGIFLHKKTFWYPILNATAAAVNVGLNFLLVPRLGIIGAAVATMVSFAVLPCMGYFISQKYYPLQYDFARVGKAVVIGAVFFIAARFIGTGHVLADAVLKCLLLSLYPFCLILVGFFEKSEIDFARGLVRGGFSRINGLLTSGSRA